MRLIYPETGDPYYIVAPSYIGTSAGVRALHLLCHSLNVSGRSAYLLPDPASVRLTFHTHPDLLTPCVTEEPEPPCAEKPPIASGPCATA